MHNDFSGLPSFPLFIKVSNKKAKLKLRAWIRYSPSSFPSFFTMLLDGLILRYPCITKTFVHNELKISALILIAASFSPGRTEWRLPFKYT
jgi:hypothetical protein